MTSSLQLEQLAPRPHYDPAPGGVRAGDHAQAMRQVAGVFAELEWAMLGKRMRDGRRRKASTGGKAVGRWPFGFRAGGTPDEREQHVLAFIRAQREAGATQRQIPDRLNNRDGWHPRNSDRWAQQNLGALLRNMP